MADEVRRPFDAITLEEAAALSGDDVIARLETSVAGLTGHQVADRRASVGANVLGTHQLHAGPVLWRQVRNPMLVLLLAAALVSGLTGGATNAVIIAVIVAASVGLGFANEYRAEVAMETLRAQIHQEAEVVRDSASARVPVSELVPGDVVTLRLGTIVPADMRLVSVSELECDEGVLTGESLPVNKSTDAVDARVGLDLPGCALMGTIVHQGSATGVVVATGSSTAFGHIAAGLAERTTRTAFELGLAKFSRLLFSVAVVLTVFIFAINVLLSRPIVEAILFSLAIAVGIAPEMMPAIVTVSLASGSRSLAAHQVLVKRLVAIEDLGNIEILFTDKTGTLTEGVITFSRSLDPLGADANRPLTLGLICSEATASAGHVVGANALDAALWSAPDSADGGPIALAASRASRLATLPFDHERQLVSVLVRQPDGAQVVITKGAPEVVIDRCVAVPDAARDVLSGLFNAGARVVAVATRSAPDATVLDASLEHALTLEGFLTFADRPKADAGTSIAQLERLGVEVKIITGDNGLVAAKVCADIGLANRGVLSGVDVDALDDDGLATAIATTTVFARIGPEQKSRIIKVARRTGKDVAFLGDGVNDAVALHHADVGISVDSGTDVAKDAADVVLLDKDLGVLAQGVIEGRRIFSNTMKYVLMATSSNFGNMFSAAGASTFLSFLPMLPSQILLNNLLYDAGQLVIPSDRVDPEALARPAAWDMRFIRRFMAVFGPVSSVFDFLTFWVMLVVLHAGHVEFRSGWFVESIATQTLVVYVIRTRRIPFFKSRPSTAMLLVPTGAALVGAVLPYTGLAHLLGFSPLPLRFFLILAGMVAVYLVLVEFAKTFFYRIRPTRVAAAPPTHEARHERLLRRRAARFVLHPTRARRARG
ncbi:MAG: magnesium-translocating P-type ATPase [Acidimicrobiales bacterium]